MKNKFISYGSCVSIFQPNLQQSFATISPISNISGPGILYSWAGSVSYTSSPSIAFGTISRVRYDQKDKLPLNQDQWVLWSTGTPSLVKIAEVQKSSVPDHHSKKMPKTLKDAPKWAADLVEEKLEQ